MRWPWRRERIEVEGGESEGMHYFTDSAKARTFFDGLGSGEGTQAAQWRRWGTAPRISGKFWTYVAEYHVTTDTIGTFET